MELVENGDGIRIILVFLCVAAVGALAWWYARRSNNKIKERLYAGLRKLDFEWSDDKNLVDQITARSTALANALGMAAISQERGRFKGVPSSHQVELDRAMQDAKKEWSALMDVLRLYPGSYLSGHRLLSSEWYNMEPYTSWAAHMHAR